jgi:hypothetical protein
MTIRIIEKHINDFPPEEYKTTYRPVVPRCFDSPGGTYAGGPGLRLLAKGEFNVLIEHYLNPLFTESAWIQLISKKTGEITRMVDGTMTWGSIDFGLKEMGHRTFHTHYAKDGNIRHSSGGSYQDRGKWKVIHELPSKNVVQIRFGVHGGAFKVVDIEREYGGNASPEEWLAILQKSENRPEFTDPWGWDKAMTILNRSYQYTPDYCESVIEQKQRQAKKE